MNNLRRRWHTRSPTLPAAILANASWRKSQPRSIFTTHLVHYLTGRLCLEQELAADDRAAELVGGRQRYMKTLATMALDQDCPKSRLVPMFLPTRKAFFRRIEMLRTQKTALAGSRRVSWLSLCLVLVLGVAVAGLRTSQGMNSSSESVTRLLEPAVLEFVPEQADFVFVIRPQVFLIDGQADWLTEMMPSKVNEGQSALDDLTVEYFGVPLDQLDQVTFAGMDLGMNGLTLVMIARTRDEGWWNGNDYAAQIKERLDMDYQSMFREYEIFHRVSDLSVPANQTRGSACFAAIGGEHTLIVASHMNSDADSSRCLMRIQDAIRSKTDATASRWHDLWARCESDSLSAYVSRDAIELSREGFDGASNPATPFMAPVWEHADRMVCGLDADNPDVGTFRLFVECGNEQGAGTVRKAMETLIPFLQLSIQQASQSQHEGDSMEAASSRMFQVFSRICETAEVSVEDNLASLQLTYEFEPGDAKVVTDFTLRTRLAAERVDSANTQRHVVIAMHNYHDAHGHFPPPVLISDSGHEYSWRVALLPYLDQGALYDSYRFNEDWNSPHNSEVTATVPYFYQHASLRSEGNPYCSVFMVVGENTPFHGNEGTNLTQIIDGTANTAALVESNLSIHWAEPRDIPFDRNHLLDQIGGFDEEGFTVSMCDGSTRFFSRDGDREELLKLFGANDGRPNSELIER